MGRTKPKSFSKKSKRDINLKMFKKVLDRQKNHEGCTARNKRIENAQHNKS